MNDMDNEATIPTGEAAIVTRNGMTEFEIVLPDYGDDETVPDVALFLTACATRYYKDDRFMDEMLNWFYNMVKEDVT